MGNRGNRRPKTRPSVLWVPDSQGRPSENIKEICGLTMVGAERLAEDRDQWMILMQRARTVVQVSTIHC